MFPKYVLLSICAFIRVHFGRPGKSSQHSPFRCIHIFSTKPFVLIGESFSKKSCKLFSFQKHVGFLAERYIFVLVCFCFCFCFLFFFHEVFCYLNICIFLWGIFAIYMHIQGILQPKHTYICSVKYFCYIHAYPRYLAT